MSAKEVDDWMAAYDNPMKEVVQKMRDIILATSPDVGETIKWQAPTFTYKGNIASFFPRAKARATLMFHKGALIPGDFPHLKGDGAEGRTFTAESVSEAEERSEELQAIVRAWMKYRDAS